MSRRELAICTGLAVAVLSVYAQTLHFEFVSLDDGAFVALNPMVGRGLTLDGVVWAFGRGEAETGNWHPLTWLSHMLDVQVFGLNAGGHHATSVLLHLLNTLLVFGLLRSATGAVWRSAVVAALFALHPLKVESVAWVSERRDVLSTAFGLLAMAAHVSYARRGGAGRQLRVALLFGLSLMAKPMLVTLPCLLLLFDYWPLRRQQPGRLVLEKLPLLAMALASSIVAFVMQRSAGALSGAEALPLQLRLLNAVHAYGAYASKLAWPVRLGPLYPHPYIPESGGVPLATWQIACALALLLGVTLLAVAARRRRYLAVGWLWYLGSLVPVIGLVQIGTQGFADRYTYVPSLGLFIAAVWGGADLLAVLESRLPRVNALAAAAVSAVLLALGVCSWLQTRHWHDSLSLYQHAVEVAPRSAKMRSYLGDELRDRGRLEDAIREYTRAVEIAPGSARIRDNLGNALRSQGRLDEAALQYRALIERDPDDPLANNGLGAVLSVQGQLDEAELHFRRALAAEPDGAAAYNLGNLLRQRGRTAEAIAVYRASLRHRPLDPKLHNNLASALEQTGDADAALEHYRTAVEIDPGYAIAHYNLASLLHRRGALEEAIEQYRLALLADPKRSSTHLYLASALEDLGRLDEAVEHYRRALELAPGDALARRSLEQALALQAETQPRVASP